MTSALISTVGYGEERATGILPAVPLTPELVGRRIAQAREELGWTQVDLSIAMHSSPGTIHRWEKGKLPSVSDLIRLTHVLGKPEDYLVESPERQVALTDLHALLAEARAEAERGRAALRESLVSIDDRLSAIEAQLAALDDLGTNRR